MYRRSGDQAGEPSPNPPKCVSCVDDCVSIVVIQISGEPPLTETNAIFRPSGEKAGSDSTLLEAAITFPSGGFLTDALTSSCQMLARRLEITYASVPWRDTAGYSATSPPDVSMD